MLGAPERPAGGPSVAALWRSVQPTAAEEASARRQLHAKAVLIGLVLVSTYAVLVLSGLAWPFRVAGAVGIVVAVIAMRPESCTTPTTGRSLATGG